MRIAIISQTLIVAHNAREDVALFKNGVPIAYFLIDDHTIRISAGLHSTAEFRIFESYMGKKALHFKDEPQIVIRHAVKVL